MPVRLGHWQSQTSNVCCRMTGQWSEGSSMSSLKPLSPSGPVSYLCSLALRIWTSSWRRKCFTGMDKWNAPMVQSRQPVTYRFVESVGLGGPRWHGSKWQRDGRVEALRELELSTLMLDTPGDLMWLICPACSKPATWKGAHWCGCCPCTCMFIKNLMMMLMMMMMMMITTFTQNIQTSLTPYQTCHKIWTTPCYYMYLLMCLRLLHEWQPV